MAISDLNRITKIVKTVLDSTGMYDTTVRLVCGKHGDNNIRIECSYSIDIPEDEEQLFKKLGVSVINPILNSDIITCRIREKDNEIKELKDIIDILRTDMKYRSKLDSSIK